MNSSFSGWIKHFADGSKYIGADQDVYAGRASWTKSPMEHVVRVDLIVDGEVQFLAGLGPYWQSDVFESSFAGRSRMIKRRIQKQIASSEEVFYPGQVGKWNTLEYDCRTKQWSRKFTEGRL